MAPLISFTLSIVIYILQLSVHSSTITYIQLSKWNIVYLPVIIYKIYTNTVMMRKLITNLVLGLAALSPLWGAPIDKLMAARIASSFVRIDTASTLRSGDLSDEAPQVVPAYYIFNDASNRGYVIVSGDDALPAVIGYSDSGSLNLKNLPIQLQTLLYRYEQRVAHVRATGASSLRSATAPLTYAKALVGPLVQTLWNQSIPYNNMAPKLDNEGRAVTGCVATAMAQLMYYHQWPTIGTGSHAYTPEHNGGAYGELSVDFSKSTYAWSDMLLTYRTNTAGVKNWTDDQAKAVARLMYDAGVSVDMDFSPDESGAYTASVSHALTEYFGYHAHYLLRTNTYGNEFYAAIKAELDASRPLIMAGAGAGGGHAWIIDGYDENGYLHSNWGWGGIANGYFLLDFMSPRELGIGGGAGAFSGDHAIVRALPNKPQTTSPYPESEPMQLGIHGAFSPKYTNGHSHAFEVILKQVFNTGSVQFTGMFGVGIFGVGQDTPLKTTRTSNVSQQAGLVPSSYFTDPFTTAISFTNLADGQYIIKPIYKATNQTEWKVMSNPMQITVELSGTQVRVLERRDQFALTLLRAPEETALSWHKTAGSTRLAIQNTSDLSLSGDLGIVFTSSTEARDTVYVGMPPIYPAALAEHSFVYNTAATKQLAVGQYEVSFIFRHNTASSAAPAYEYYPIANPHGTYTIEVRPVDQTAALTLEQVKLYERTTPIETSRLSKADLEGKEIYIGAIVRNVGTVDYSGTIRYQLMDVTEGSIATIGESPVISARAGRTSATFAARARLDLSTLALKDNHYYRLLINYRTGDAYTDIWSANQSRLHYLYLEASATSTSEVLSRTSVTKVFPTQTDDFVHLEGERIEQVEVISSSGSLVAKHAVGGSSTYTLHFGDMSAGIYFVRLQTARGIEVIRVSRR